MKFKFFLTVLILGPMLCFAQYPPSAKLAFDFLNIVADTSNVVFSPVSVGEASGMLSAGACSRTLKALANIFSDGDTSVNAHSLWKNPLPSNAFSLTNSIWYQKGVVFQEAYRKQVSDYYNAVLHESNFASNPDKQRKIINADIEKTTAGNIKNMLPTGAVNQSTRLVLVNALYFKSAWKIPFEKGSNTDADFKNNNGTKKNTLFLSHEGKYFYAESDKFQAVSLPYADGDTEMLIIKPVNGDLQFDFTFEDYVDIESRLTFGQILVKIPAFKIESSFSLKKAFKVAGADMIFNPTAQFCKFYDDENLFVSDVLHAATIEVNNAGTEASAATAIPLMRSAVVSLKDFCADSPFVFVIRSFATGNIAFAGRVMNFK